MQFNPEQLITIDAIVSFATSPSPEIEMMAVSGPAGAGKTTIIKEAVRQIDNRYKTREALGLNEKRRKIQFTATTNKSADVLSQSVESVALEPVATIHSFLSLHLQEDAQTLKDVLVSSRPEQKVYHTVIIIDEASIVTLNLLCLILSKCGQGTRIIFLGDAAQCLDVGDGEPTQTTKDLINPAEVIDKYGITNVKLPVFNMNCPVFELTKVERSDKDNPMQKIVLNLRQMILDGKVNLPNAGVNGKEIRWYPRDEFDALVLRDMSSPDWTYSTSKVLAFRNKRVRHYNNMVTEITHGASTPRKGDYMVNNEYVGNTKTTPSIGTDRTVLITDVSELTKVHGVDGWWVHTSLNPKDSYMPGKQGNDTLMEPYFLPMDAHHKGRLTEKYRKRLLKLNADPLADFASPEYKQTANLLAFFKCRWVDFRPMYACTMMKSQGSTFRRVFIDLGDLSTCYDLDQRNRMLYVAFSRARMQVFLTGNIT